MNIGQNIEEYYKMCAILLPIWMAATGVQVMCKWFGRVCFLQSLEHSCFLNFNVISFSCNTDNKSNNITSHIRLLLLVYNKHHKDMKMTNYNVHRWLMFLSLHIYRYNISRSNVTLSLRPLQWTYMSTNGGITWKLAGDHMHMHC